ncbi:MAG TPA: DUF3597 domain-containing protein [Methylocella sp.]|nr:DUF3597 domain-containing protein [Methylocella sp.]
MSIFGTIMSKILGRTPASPVVASQDAPAAQPNPAPSALAGKATAATASAAPASSPVVSAPAGPPVDVAAVLDALNDKVTQELDWKHSIVDLMKLLSLDSSLAARKELAKELHYGGDTGDSATMNVWLHKQIMLNLAANGGKLPDDLKNLT